jgi:hypothetical protein
MQFLYQPLTWGFLLIGVPILIHLINMLRHRKQKWAAMDFLLESHRRNRRWVMLKQWLLLAARILAMILLVAMLAKWVSSSRLLGMLGGQSTHHYILLDDSYSMAEFDQSETAYSRSLRALSGLVRSIAARTGQHQITLVRLSRAALATRGGGEEARVDVAADLIAQTVPRDPDRLLDRLTATRPTALQLSPLEGLELIEPMIVDNSDEQAEVYLLSDLRRNEFGEPELLRNKLQSLADAATGIHLIDCGGETGANLSLVNIEPEQEVWAAGVPLMVRFQVRNQANRAARNVVVKIRAITYGDGVTAPRPDSNYSGDVLELPPVVVEAIDPGETVTRQVQVVFGVAGKHVVEVSLPEDTLAVDDRRWCVINIRESQRVLLVDGEIDGSNAYYFQTVLAPDARLRTGMTSQQVDASYLRDAAPETLSQFDVVALLDVPRLDRQAVEKLEDYCRAGGGVFFACGRNTNLQFVNQELVREGEGLFPVALKEIRELDADAEPGEPQVMAGEHPILAPLRQLSVSPFSLLRIRQLLVPEAESASAAGLETIASGPDNLPLMIDKPFGDGRVVALLTGLTNDWSTWAQDPTFVVMALRSFGYLGSFRRSPTSEPVGSPVEMVVSGQTILPEAEILLPPTDGGRRTRLLEKVRLEGTTPEVARVGLSIDLSEMDRDLVDGALRPGIFETWMINGQGEKLFENFARNVAAAEGNLQRVSHSELESKLVGIPLDIRTADSLSDSGLSSSEASHSTLLLALLAGLLMAEQWLAYSASYHAPRFIGALR